MFDIKSLIHKPFGDSRYPDKREINLYPQRVRNDVLLVKSITIVVAMMCSALGISVFILAPLKQVARAERIYRSMEEQIENLYSDNADADEIKREYAHYGFGHLTESEKAFPDKMMMLETIEKRILPFCRQISSVIVTEDRMEISCTRNREIPLSKLIESIEKEEMVRYVMILRETSADSQDERGFFVDMVIYFDLKKEGMESQ